MLAPFYLLSAFASENQLGNQAAVMFLPDLSDETLLKKIAADFNFPATAFLKQLDKSSYEIRWFTADHEIPLCGHGSIAAGEVLFNHLNLHAPITLKYKQGTIQLSREKNGKVGFETFAIPVSEASIPVGLEKALGASILHYYAGGDKDLVVLENEDVVRKLQPDWEALKQLKTFAYTVTARGSKSDMVSRVFLPFVSFLEDPATGSAHCMLAPYWSKQLGKNYLTAEQASKRGGWMECEVKPDRVKLIAQARFFGKGEYSL